MCERIDLAPLISIISVVRNDRIGLEKTRDSIFGQSFCNWEWIVIDGLSNDDTLLAIDQVIHDPRVRVISEKDHGIYDAMNKGVGLANGGFVNLLNAGDVYNANDALSSCVELLRAGAIDILFTSRIAVFGAGDRIRLPVRTEPNRIMHSLPTSHQACFIRTSLQRAFPYRLDHSIAADYRCIAEIVNSGASIGFLDHATVISDLGAASTSFRHPLTHLRDCAKTQREVFRMSRLGIWRSALRRLVPIVFRALSAHIPGLSVIVRTMRSGS